MKLELKQEVFDGITTCCLERYRSGERLSADEMLMELMDVPGVPMHFPYHHYIMPAALLTLAAMETGQSEEKLSEELKKAEERGKLVPGGFCGACGACGAGVGVGICVSVYTGASPHTVENWQWANEATGLCLQHIGAYPGPRCCKRTGFLALQQGVPYFNEKCGLHLEISGKIICKYHKKNPDCIGERCPFYPKEG